LRFFILFYCSTADPVHVPVLFCAVRSTKKQNKGLMKKTAKPLVCYCSISGKGEQVTFVNVMSHKCAVFADIGRKSSGIFCKHGFDQLFSACGSKPPEHCKRKFPLWSIKVISSAPRYRSAA
jgi:hypothetical protein